SVLTFTLTASGANFNFANSTLTFSYNRGGNEAPTGINWSYTISGGGGGANSLAPSTLTGTGAWNSTSVDFSSFTLPNTRTLTITGTLTGGTSGGTGDLSFDNFAVNVVPEPVHIALGIFGLLFLGTGLCRLYMVRIRRA